MPITIDTDSSGRIWRLVDGMPAEELIFHAPDDAATYGLTRYGDAYPGERWDTTGSVIRPEHVPRLYLAPVPAVEEAPLPSYRAHRPRAPSVPAPVKTPTAPDEPEEHA